MKDVPVAGRYARALLLLIERRSTGPALLLALDRALADLRGLDELVRPGTRFGGLLGHPQVRPEDKRAMLKKALDGRAERTVTVFADLLLRKKRLPLLPQIVREFDALVDRAKGVQHAEVVSAVPLTLEELAQLHSRLERRTGLKLTVDAVVDPALVGGAYARIGDRIIDRSVRGLLESLANHLYEVSV
jgi:F-type H+-transporting ATPase subunit delta